MESPALDIRLLGKMEVLREDRPVDLPRSRKTRALMAYLAATGCMHSRQQLCDLLFESPADPRAALRWSLSKFRSLVDDDRNTRVIADRDRIGFEPQGAWVDVVDVRRQSASGVSEAPTDMLQAMADRFRGPFLEGLDMPECYRFDAWCTAEREAVRTLQDDVLRTLVERLYDEPRQALRYAGDRLFIDPLSEDAHLDLMRILGSMGHTSEALAQYERCRQMLSYEFGARPSAKMEALRRSLTRPRSAPVSPVPSKPASTGGLLPPLVGRRKECDSFRNWLADETDDVLVLLGPPGIGKTRLLEEIRAQVQAAGGRVLRGRAFDVERVRPYGAWIDALRGIDPEELPPELRARLAPFLPELGAASEEVNDRNRLFDAVLDLLIGMSEEGEPFVVLLDDLQWLDDTSVALLHYVARGTAGRSVRLACAARFVDLEDNPSARRLLQALRREHRLRALDLSPLDGDDTLLLVQNVDSGLDAARIFADSGGNPLFALEIARARRAGDEVLPATLDGLITERLTALEPQARELLPWAAALGRGFELGVLSKVTQCSLMDILDAVERLERRDILRVTDTGTYDFVHDLVRRAAYQSISSPRRRVIHLQIAQTLTGPDGFDASTAGEVARHAALGGDRELAARACIAAGRAGQRVFAYEEAAALAEKGLEHLETLSQEKRLPLHLDLLSLYVHPGMTGFCPLDLEERLRRVTAEAQAAGRPALMRQGFYIFGWLYYQRGDFSSALDATRSAEEAGREADPVTVVEAIADTSHCLCLIEREMDRAEKLALEAQSLVEEFDLKIQSCELPMALAMLCRHTGVLDEARRHAERGLRCAENDPHLWKRHHCLSHLIMIELESGRPEEALAQCRNLLDMTEKIDAGSMAPFAAALEALALRALDRDTPGKALDLAVERLRLVDSKWMLAYVQNMAAARALNAGCPDEAGGRAEDAHLAAEAVNRRSEAAVAHAILARVARMQGDANLAARQIEAVQDDMAAPHLLSARARRAVEQAAEPLAELHAACQT